MADDDTHPGMTKLSRHVYGPRPIAALIPSVARTAFRRAAPAVAQLSEGWVGIVGPALAGTTAPRRLAQGTLVIECNGPVAMELQHLSVELLNRINLYLGSQAVRRLRFVQTMAARIQVRQRVCSNETVDRAAAQAVSHLPDGPLRSALASLGRAVMTETPSRLGKQPRTRY
jgi:hypothetical protein